MRRCASRIVFGLSLLACGQAQGPLYLPEMLMLARHPVSEHSLLVRGGSVDLLGRVVDAPWQSTEEPMQISRDNPCRDELVLSESRVAEQFVDAETARDVGLLDELGLAGLTLVTTTMFYHVHSRGRWTATAGEAYEACCAERDCGAGFVAAVHTGLVEIYPADVVLEGVPVVMVADPDNGAAVGLALHQGRKYEGVVLATLSLDDDWVRDSAFGEPPPQPTPAP